MQIKYFYHFADSWYYEKHKDHLFGGACDDILIGFQEAPESMSVVPHAYVVKEPIEDSDNQEIRIAWYPGNRTSLELSPNTFSLLKSEEIQELLEELNEINDEDYWHVDQVKEVLINSGFMDVTKTSESDEIETE